MCTCMCLYTYVCVHVYIMHTCVYMCVCARLCMHVPKFCICTCVYMRLCLHADGCVHILTPIFISTTHNMSCTVMYMCNLLIVHDTPVSMTDWMISNVP